MVDYSHIVMRMFCECFVNVLLVVAAFIIEILNTN